MQATTRTLRLTTAALAMLSSAILAAPPEPNSWPGWRGPTSDGLSVAKDFPRTWSPGSNVAWKAPVEGRGHSSPVVWGDRIFITTDVEGDVIPGAGAVKHRLEGQPYVHPDATGANRKHTLKTLCYDARDGKLLWDRIAYQGPVFDDVAKFNTFASPTVVTDGKYVYAYFESQGLYKYDFGGERVWGMSFGGIATLGVGTGVSPVLAGDKIIILADQEEGENSFIAAVSTRDGKIAWKKPRKNALTWTVPLVTEIAGRSQIIVPSTEDVVAYDPSDGREIWKTEGLDSNVVHTPVAGNGMVYVSAGYPKKIIMAIRQRPAPGESRVVWKYDRGTGYLPSALLLGNYLYVMTDAGLLTCLDARTGVPLYEGKRFKRPAKFVSPMVAADEMILATSEDGDTYIVKAGPQFEVVADNSVDEPVYAGLAVVGHSIYVRAAQHLYCLRAAKP